MAISFKTDAKHLPTVVVTHDESQFTNSILQAFINSGYFNISKVTHNDEEAKKQFNSGKTEFVISIPNDFSRDLILNKKPHILLEGNAIDPVAVNGAFHSTNGIIDYSLKNDLKGQLSYLAPSSATFQIDTHGKYNPTLKSQYHTLPGLIVSILTIALTMITTISITSEYEHGTMESLLITPLKPLEIILGKILPNIVLGYILLFLTLIVSRCLFRVPFEGSLLLLSVALLPFFISNLGIGIAVSTIAKTQFQAANMSNTYTLPALLLSGFLFPFYAMPTWAQWIGNLFPTTHSLRIVSNIMLKRFGIR